MMSGCKRLLVAAFTVFLNHSVSADVDCTFHMRSTISENQKLTGSRFRVREDYGVLQLEQRYADGKWRLLGEVQRFDRPGFIVFLHLPVGGRYEGRSRMLTVHQSGNGSLAIHHGSAGGGSQIKRAWLYQGACEETPNF
jgi:hypothetical protein